MKTTRKLLVLCLAALVGVFCIMPSTFSWYTRDGSFTGNRMLYSRSGMPVSTGSVTVETQKSNGDSIPSNANTSIDADSTQYFTTTITNNGSRDIYVDLGLSNLTNSNKVFVGTTSPTINQKSYASRPILTTAESDFTRIYFEARNEDHNKNIEYWLNSVTKIVYVDKKGDTQEAPLRSIASDFTVSPEIKDDKYSVFYYDLPAGAQSFYFKNSTYYDNDHDRNRTQTINEFEPGLVYYLNGNSNNYGNKEVSTHDELSSSLVSVARSYSAVTMSTGRIANLALADGTDYTGKTIAYSVTSGNASTTSDGKVTATGSGNATFTTTITGYLGDTKTLTTSITIPTTLAQVPVAKNILVPKSGGKKEISWYIYNTDTTNDAEFRSVFYTI